MKGWKAYFAAGLLALVGLGVLAVAADYWAVKYDWAKTVTVVPRAKPAHMDMFQPGFYASKGVCMLEGTPPCTGQKMKELEWDWSELTDRI